MTSILSPSENRKNLLLGTVLPVAFIAVLVIVLWLPFGLKTTGLVEEWDIVGLLRMGYSLFFVDPNSVLGAHAIRPFTVLPHAIAYTLDPNSFIWFNIQQIIFFIGKGVFAFLLLRRLLPKHDLLSFAVAVLFVIHPADTGLFTFRAIHIHAAVMFYFMAAYFLLVYWDTQKWWTLILMWVALLFSLFLYEVAYPVVAATPLLLLYKDRRLSKRVIRGSVLWYLVPLLTGLRVLAILVTSRSGDLYQTGVIGSINPSGILQAVAYLYRRSFVDSWIETLSNINYSATLLIISVGLGVVVLVLSLTLARWQSQNDNRLKTSSYVTLFVLSLGFILLGFSPYLLANSHRFLTLRTYYLPSFGAALCLFLLLYLVIKNKAAFAFVATALIFVSLLHAFQQHNYYVGLALRQQRFLGQMLEIAPAVQPDTTVVVVDNTGLLDDEWFFRTNARLAFAIGYVYGETVKAYLCFGPKMYSYANAVDRAVCSFSTDTFSFDAPTLPEFSSTTPYNRIIVLEYTYAEELQLVDDLSRYVVSSAAASYDPEALIQFSASAESMTLFSCLLPDSCTTPIVELLHHNPVHLSLDQASVVGTGWRPSETTSDGTVFRWITAKEASIELRLDEGNGYRVQFLVPTYLTVDILDMLHLYVNNTPIELTHGSTEDGIVYTGYLPHQSLAQDVDQFVFALDKLDRVEGTNVDLGVAVSWLAFEPIEPQTSGFVDFDQALSGSGWRGVETTADGVTFQWSTTENASVDLGWLEAQDYTIEMRPLYIPEPMAMDDVQFKVDDVRLEIEQATDEAGNLLLRATLPAEVVDDHEQGIHLTIAVPQVVNVDGNTLGIAVDWLRVTPQ
jgi:hypothetical protein